MAKSDGSVIIDTRMNTDGFQSGVTNMKKGFDGIGSALGKIAKVMVGVFAVGKLVQFGKEAIALGSDLSEVQNVVDVTFEDLNEEINQFAKNALEQFGLSETAAKQYTSTMGAMLKSMGFTTREAADMGKTMTGLAADMASFYNLSAEDAFYKIRAGISGETEPLKQLGINLNVANLEQYALTQGITKSYNAMNQQEQALLRYNYLLSVTADAQGDFARTSDSWANQTRILSEQFNALKATIGQGLINVFTPVLKLLNALLARLQTVANAFKAFTELITGNKASSGGGGGVAAAIPADDYSAATDGAENYASAQEDAADATKAARKETNKYLSGLDEVRTFQEDTPTASGGGSGGGGGGVGSGGGGLAVDYGNLAEGQTVVDKITESFDKLLELFKPMREAWAEYGDSIKTSLGKIGQDFAEFGAKIAKSTYDWFSGLDWSPLLKSVDSLLQNLEPLVDLILDGLAWAYENVLLPFEKWRIEEFVPIAVENLGKAFELLRVILVALQPVFMWLWQNILVPFGQTVGEVAINIMQAFGGVLDFLTGVFSGNWSLAFEGIKTIVSNFFSAIDTIVSGAVDILFNLISAAWKLIKNITESVWNGIKNFVKGVWDGIKGLAIAFANIIVEIFKGIDKAVSVAVDILCVVVSNAWKLIKFITISFWNAIKSFLIGIWDGIKGWATTFAQIIQTLFTVAWNAIKAVTTSIWNAIKSALSSAWESIKNTASNVFNFIKNTISNIWNAIKTNALSVWSNIQSAVFNSWNSIKNTAFNVFNSIKTTIANIWDSIKNGAVNSWNALRNSIGSIVNGIYSTISNVFNKASNAVGNAFNSMVNFVRNPINSIISILNGLMSGVATAVNGVARMFNSMRVDIPSWVPGIGGKSLGFSLPTWTPGHVPYLAKGAVIPPNAPFMAMLGDQKRGTNIEAPLSTIEQAVANVLKRNGSGSQGMTIRIPVILNGRQVFEAVIDEAKMKQMVSGRNPFEMA